MNTTTTTTRFKLTHGVGAWWSRQRESRRCQALRRACPPATVAAGQIPAAVRASWAHHAPDEFPGLPVDDGAWLRCSLGLAQFFEACRLQAGQGPCALPSKAADSVWHVWLKVDADGLARWQQQYFGRVVPHRDATALGSPLENCLARTWAGACRSQGLDMLGPQLPLLFALDGLLALPTGWAYRHERGQLVHRAIDGFGQASGPQVAHPGLAGSSLLALGLLSAAELEAMRRRLADGSSASGAEGLSTTAEGGDCSGDAGSDGGCSCGSGCGGD